MTIRLRNRPQAIETTAGAPVHVAPRELFIRGHTESGVPELAAALHASPTIWASGSFGLGAIVTAARRAAATIALSSADSSNALLTSTDDLVRRTMRAAAEHKPGAHWIADAAEEPVEPILSDATYIYLVRDGRDVVVAEALRQLRAGGPLFSDQRYRARLEHLREELRRDPNLLADRPHRLFWLQPWLRQLSRAWATQVQSDLAALNRLAAAGARTLVIRYESLAAPAASADSRDLASLLSLDSVALNLAQGDLAHAVGIWPRFFTPEYAAVFHEEAGAALSQLGIADSDGWISTLPAPASQPVTNPTSSAAPAAGPSSTFDEMIALHADPVSLASDGQSEHTITIDGASRNLFFICGHPRSGTTWTVAVMNLHPRIFVQGEFRFEALRNGFDQLTRWPWHVAYHEPIRTEAERAARESIRRIMGAITANKPDAQWLGDKTPRSLRVLIPGAPHVLLVRDGRDVLVSRTFHELSSGGVMLNDPLYAGRMLDLQQQFLANPDLFRREPHRLLSEEHWVRTLARQWAQQMRHDLAVAAVMRDRARTPLYELRYERMRADVESERASLYRFLGLDPTEAAPVSAANRSAPGFEAETPNGFYRKGEAGDWNNYMTDDARRWFKHAAGDQLIALGYEKDGSW